MVIDVHGHLTAPDSLYVFKANILSHRGSHGRGKVEVSDDEMIAFLKQPTFGTGKSHFDLLKEVGTDIQLLSPRPYQMMMAEKPAKVSRVVHRRVQHHGLAAVPAFSECIPGRLRLAAVTRRKPEELHFRARTLREGIWICGVPDQSGPERSDELRHAGNGRRILVSAVRKIGRAGRAGIHPRRGLPLGPAQLLHSFHQ